MLNANGNVANGSSLGSNNGVILTSNGHSNNSNDHTTLNGNTGALVSSKALMLTNGSGLYKVFSTESVLNLLHCLYCKKPYKDPRLLHCGHTYCLPCLIQMNRYSTIRCIKCNSLQTVTSHAVDTLPKNLFVADIQCIPTVEIDRGAAYKETLRSLEDLKVKLLDFSDKLDQSENKLFKICEIKKKEVSEQVSKIIEFIRLMEEDFYGEIEEFKKNRLSVLRSAPPEFKETNANLLQFVNQSLDDMMRPDIKEEDVKEIYNRCEEHRRLWNETEIIFNSNYAIGEIHFHKNDNLPKKEDLVGAIIQKLPQKLNAQRTAKGPISISECCVDGEYIIIENTSKRHDVNMTNWLLTHCVGSVRKVSFKFPENFIVKSKQRVKLWAGNKNSITYSTNKKYVNDISISTNNTTLTSSTLCKSPTLNGKHLNNNTTKMNGHHHYNGNHNNNNSHNTKDNLSSTNTSSPLLSLPNDINASLNDINECIENELILYDIENWTCGAQEMFIRLENEFGEEKALFRKTN